MFRRIKAGYQMKILRSSMTKWLTNEGEYKAKIELKKLYFLPVLIDEIM